jgi:hypothetical protein
LRDHACWSTTAGPNPTPTDTDTDNPYRYAANNPIDNWDSTGRWPWDGLSDFLESDDGCSFAFYAAGVGIGVGLTLAPVSAGASLIAGAAFATAGYAGESVACG